MQRFTFRLRSLLIAIAVVALFFALWRMALTHDLDKWQDPADQGKAIIAIRVYDGSVQILEMAEEVLATVVPSAYHATDSHWQDGYFHQQGIDGFLRTKVDASTIDDRQKLVDDCRSAVVAHFRQQNIEADFDICLVDEHGNITRPTPVRRQP